MKSAAVLFALFLAPAWAQLPRPTAAAPTAAPATASAAAPAVVAPTETPRVARPAISDLERRLDTKLTGLGGANDPIDLLGATRGLYLDGYGVVLTAEASLIVVPGINPFHSAMTGPEKEKIRQRKLDRMPMLRQAMRDAWRDSAAALTAMPDNQQVVIAVRLLYLSSEDTRGLPAEIVMKGDRRTALAGAPQMEER